MAAIAGKKIIGGSSATDGQFSNEERWIKVTYDFSVDTGAQADLEVLENGSSASYMIIDFYAYVDGKASWDEGHLALVATAFMQAAIKLGYKIQWGGLWKGFKDMPHIQLVEGNP